MKLSCIVILLGYFILSAIAQDVSNTGQIQGIVVDGETGAPLSNVIIQTFPRFIRGFEMIGTDLNGRFTIEGINAKTVRLVGSKPGYSPPRFEGRKVPGNVGITLTLVPGEHRNDVVVRMFRAAIVTGRVVDRTGGPIPGVVVIPFRYSYDETGQLVQQSIGSGETDDRGEFRLTYLDTGEYYFLFLPPSVKEGVRSIAASYYLAYYPETRDAFRAIPVQIKNGNEVRLDTVTLPSAPGGNLKIHIIDETGQQGGLSEVSVWRKGEPFDVANFLVAATRDRAEIAGLAPGNYQVKVQINNSIGFGEISTKDVDSDLDVVVSRPGLLTGTVGLMGAGDDLPFRPVPNVRIVFQGYSANNSMSGPVKTSGPDGKFSDPTLPPGLYVVSSVTAPSGMYIKSIQIGNRDVIGEKFQMDGGNLKLDVTLGEGLGTVNGTVRDDKDRKVPGAIVALLPDDRSRRGLFISKSTDENGDFEITGAPGSYHLYSWLELDGSAFRNVEFMKKYDLGGISVRIEADGKVVRDLTVLEP